MVSDDEVRGKGRTKAEQAAYREGFKKAQAQSRKSFDWLKGRVAALTQENEELRRQRGDEKQGRTG